MCNIFGILVYKSLGFGSARLDIIGGSTAALFADLCGVQAVPVRHQLLHVGVRVVFGR